MTPATAEPIVSVVIVNWNGAEHLTECLEALARQTYRDRTEVIVVDNGSVDASVSMIRAAAVVDQLIVNESNRGFSGGCNDGINRARGRYVALLNNDAVPGDRWLESLVSAIGTDPAIGSCASKVVSYFDERVIDNAGHVVYRDGLTRGRGRLELDRGQFDRVEEVFCASGCAMLLRREMLDEIGLFDESFFAYCEDADLGFRARFAGWRCLYVPAARVRHKFSATAGSFSAMKALNVERNRFWLAVKNFPAPIFVSSLFFTAFRYLWQAWGALSGQGASGRFSSTSGGGALARLLMRAWIEGLMGLPRMYRARRRCARLRKLGTAEARRWFRQFGIGARRIALME